MKKVININFQGRVVPIEELAYDKLKAYVESLRRYFDKEEGKDEIVNDIESRISELFGEKLLNGKGCITEEDLDAIMASIGTPKELGQEEEIGGGESQRETKTEYGGQGNYYRKLSRDLNKKLIGGVCAGISNYFGIDLLLVRVLVFVTAGITFVPYIVLWIALPATTEEAASGNRKRLFRDGEDKLVAGVASGIGHYFGLKPWLVRILFIVPFLSFAFSIHNIGLFHSPNFLGLSFSPGTIVVYIILWLLMPEAMTTAEKLEMKGEPVNLDSIKNTIQSDLYGFKGRAEKFGEDIKERAEKWGKDMGPQARKFGQETMGTLSKSRSGIGGLIAILVKLFIYLICGTVLVSIVASLFAIGVGLFAVSPVYDFILDNSLSKAIVWFAIILTIWVPIIGIVTWGIRKISNRKRYGMPLGFAFMSLWLIGIACLVWVGTIIFSNFKYREYTGTEKIELKNANLPKLEVKLSNFGHANHQNWLKVYPLELVDQDTLFFPSTQVKIVKSESDSFEVFVTKSSFGPTKKSALEKAGRIQYSFAQSDSVLKFIKGPLISRAEKFSNQHFILTIAVPVGKRIRIDSKHVFNIQVGFDFNDREDRWDDENLEPRGFYWQPNEEYVMTPTGLRSIDPAFQNKKQYRDDDFGSSNDEEEEIKESLEEKRREIEEKKREIEESNREMQQELEEKKRELEEEKRKLKRSDRRETRFRNPETKLQNQI